MRCLAGMCSDYWRDLDATMPGTGATVPGIKKTLSKDFIALGRIYRP